ncbi:hypothetical protein HAX54_019645, partial [Datura stramonium]|nr:hypothetical protein [Datura stramonium]
MCGRRVDGGMRKPIIERAGGRTSGQANGLRVVHSSPTLGVARRAFAPPQWE